MGSIFDLSNDAQQFSNFANTGAGGAAMDATGVYGLGIPSLYAQISQLLTPPKPQLQNPAVAGAPPSLGQATTDQAANTLSGEVAQKQNGQAAANLSPMAQGLDSNPMTTSRVLLGS